MTIRPFIYFINVSYFDSASVEFWKLWKDAYEYVCVSPSTLCISVVCCLVSCSVSCKI